MLQALPELRKAREIGYQMAARRANELEARHPQLAKYNNQVEDTSPAVFESGGAAGLERVVGSGKHSKKGASNGVMYESDSEEEEMRGGAYGEGRKLGKHLMDLHGGGFVEDFLSGVKSVSNMASNIPGVGAILGLPAKGIEAAEKLGEALHGKVRRRGVDYATGGARALPESARFKPMGTNVAHAMMSSIYDSLPGSGTSGADVPPGGIAPVAYGLPPQAPASFRRNTVGMGKLTITHGGKSHSSRAPSARHAIVKQVMKEKGMSMPEASRYVKQNNLY